MIGTNREKRTFFHRINLNLTRKSNQTEEKNAPFGKQNKNTKEEEKTNHQSPQVFTIRFADGENDQKIKLIWLRRDRETRVFWV